MKKNIGNFLALSLTLKTVMAIAASGSAPIATPDAIDAEIDAIVKINPLSNDSGDGIALSSATSTKGAIVNLFGGQVIYRFPANAPVTATDSVIYTLTDKVGNSATSTIEVHLMKDGNYIDAVPDTAFSINDDDTAAELGKINIIDVLANDTSPDGGLVITEAASTGGAKVEVKENKINYIAWDSSITSDSVIYYVHDASGHFGWATLNVDISGGGVKFRANDDNLVAIFDKQNPEAEDMSFVLENDKFDNATGTISTMESGNGTIFKSKQGQWMYAPQQAGEDAITYTLMNTATGEESSANVKINVLPVTSIVSELKAVNDTYSLKINDDGLSPDLDLSQVLKNDEITPTTKISRATAVTGKTYLHNGTPYYHATHAGTDTVVYHLLDNQTGEVASAVASISVMQ